MTTDTYPYRVEPKPLGRILRRVFVILLLLTLIPALWLAFLLHDEEPNYYRPARAALVVARHRLNEYYSHESVIIQQLRKAHIELDAAMSMLNKAENLDPSDKKRLDSLSLRLRRLKDVKQAALMSPDQLHDSYRAVAEELDEITHKLELPNH